MDSIFGGRSEEFVEFTLGAELSSVTTTGMKVEESWGLTSRQEGAGVKGRGLGAAHAWWEWVLVVR